MVIKSCGNYWWGRCFFVGASLLAKAVDKSILVLNVRPSSRAGSLPQGSCGGSDVEHFHLAQHFANRGHGFAHFGRLDMADAADAEGFDLGQLAGVEDVALGL